MSKTLRGWSESRDKQHGAVWVSRLALAFSGLLIVAGCTSVTEAAPASLTPSSETPETVAEESATSNPIEVEDEATQTDGTFRVSVTDYDENPGDYPEFEVWVRDYGSWFPNFEFGGDLLESVGPFPVGELIEGDIYIYPFGRDGIEVAVPIRLSEEHISDSTRDMLSIYVEAGVLTVFGTVVEGLELTQNLR